MNCSIFIDNKPFSFELSGEFTHGADEILYTNHSGVIDHCSWANEGYTILDLLTPAEFGLLKESVNRIIKKILTEIGLTIPNTFHIKDYHEIVNTDALHDKVISKTRFLTKKDFSIDMDLIAKKVSEYVGKNFDMTNPQLEEEIIILRISRPRSMDINPLHRDGYLDIWKDVLNLWIPIEGCNELSSLPLAPRSHFWNEKDILKTQNKGASINGKSYHVPGIVYHKSPIRLIRPNPKLTQALLFTPYIVHGAAINANLDQTRFSLELRPCKT